MDIINKTPFTFASIVGKINFPKNSLTFILKGTFNLKNGDITAPAEEQLFPTGDEFYPDDDDMIGSLRYSSDFVYFKPMADLLLVGKCCAPHGEKASTQMVKFQVGSKTKTLNVYGDRFLKQDLLSSSATAPEPYSQLELRYENSYGGEGFEPNPVGKGFSTVENERGGKMYALPNILKYGDQINSPQAKSEPAGFGPLSPLWKHRLSKLGSYKGNYLKERWPWFSKDFDWSYYNSAPADMQVKGYLSGDEKLYFENLHPVFRQYRSQLPGMRVRCFINVLNDKNHEMFKEVRMNLDTLWTDMDQEKLVLVWRGFTEVKTEDYEEIKQVVVAYEKLTHIPEHADHYRMLLEKELIMPEQEREIFQEEPAESDDLEDIETQKEIAAAEEQMRAALIESGIDPDNIPPINEEEKAKEAELLKEFGFEEEEEEIPLNREIFIERAKRMESFAEEDLTGIDLSGLDLRDLNFQNAVLSAVNLKNSDLSNANFEGANLSLADLSNAKMNNTKMKDADLTEALLPNSDLTGAEIEHAVFEKAKLSQALLNEVKGKNVFFPGADLSEASLVNSNFQGADFSKSIIYKADFRKSNLCEASVEGCSGIQANFSGTNLSGLKASGRADFTGALFRNAKGAESIWEHSILNETDFSFSEMEAANFTAASLLGADLTAANMKSAKFTKADLSNAVIKDMNLFQGSLEKANLTNADCSRSNFYGVEFLDSKIANTRFKSANLKMTKLA